MWTGKAGKERSMHVCVAQAPAGRIEIGVPMSRSVSKQTGPNGAKWADVTQGFVKYHGHPTDITDITDKRV